MERTGISAVIGLLVVSVLGLLGIGLGAVLPPTTSFTVQDSTLERVSSVIDVKDNDEVTISETLYYNTEDINGVERTFGYTMERNENITIDSVFVNGTPSRRVENADKGQSGVYTVFDTGGEQVLRVYERTSGRTMVTINYHVRGLLKEYTDVQDFNLKVYDARFGETPKALDATITFPVAIPRDKFLVFGHGDVEGDVKIVDDRTVKADITGMYKDTFAEVRVLLPDNPIPGVMNKKPEAQFQNFLNYEQTEAEKTNQELAKNAQKGNNTNMLLLALGLFWVFIIVCLFQVFNTIYRKYDKEQYVSELEYFREVPTYSPAVASHVLDHFTFTTQEQLIATIFSLYTKKVISLEELNKDVKITFLQKPEALSEDALSVDERFVYDWMWEKFDGAGTGTYKEFFNVGNRKISAARAFEKQFDSFAGVVTEEYRRLDFERYHGRDAKFPKIMYWLIFALIAIIGLTAIWFTFGYLLSIGFIIVIGLTLLFLVAFEILYLYKNNAYQLTQEGAAAHGQVRGLKNYLNDYSLLKEAEPTAVHLWEKYFVYGMALGVTKKALNALYQRIPQGLQESSDWQTLYTMNNLSYHYNIVHRSEQAYTKMSTAIATTSRTSGGSSFGGGGGFSGGGGFGSGGGGSSTF